MRKILVMAAAVMFFAVAIPSDSVSPLKTPLPIIKRDVTSMFLSDEIQITFSPFDHGIPQWSHDGSWLCYHREDSAGYYQIYMLEIANGEEIPLTNSTFNHMLPPFSGWSPNDKWIVCERYDENGFSQICLINISGKDEIILTDDLVNHAFPTWSPDGK